MPYLKYFLLTGLLPIFFIFLIGFYLQPISGDLTRVGNLSERDFGWNAAQQQITIKATPHTRLPEVIVIGDSFSVNNIWQSLAEEESRLSFMTFNWKLFANSIDCLEHWLLTVKHEYPTCKFIVIETTERDWLGRFYPKNKPCADDNKNPIQVRSSVTARMRNTARMDAMPDPFYAIISSWNSLRTFNKIEKTNDVYVAPLTSDKLFSNKRSNLLLYYENDNLKESWKQEEVQAAVEKMLKIQNMAKHQGLLLFFAVVPDKSTAYSKYFQYPQFAAPVADVWAELDRRRCNSVNLKQILTKAVDEYQDVYLPDDTHVGSKGYSLIAQAITVQLKAFDEGAAK